MVQDRGAAKCAKPTEDNEKDVMLTVALNVLEPISSMQIGHDQMCDDVFCT